MRTDSTQASCVCAELRKREAIIEMRTGRETGLTDLLLPIGRGAEARPTWCVLLVCLIFVVGNYTGSAFSEYGWSFKSLGYDLRCKCDELNTHGVMILANEKESKIAE